MDRPALRGGASLGLALASSYFPKPPHHIAARTWCAIKKHSGDTQPANADDLHTALQGKSADGRKQQATQPSHDFDYPD